MYPDFFDKTLVFIPLALEVVRMNKDGRSFRVAYVFGVRVFISVM